ncbi:MAG: Na/Pi cotransporter family protein [Candidatus Cloacimonas sp.]|nr:Na/Pi cotransporter family protein [Candidatus Cloacimonadota bacterium]
MKKIVKILLITLLLGFSALYAEYNIELIGNKQSSKISQPLKDEIAVRITDSQGQPVVEVEVEFVTPKNGLILDATVLITDSNGYVTNSVILGPQMGDYDVEVIVRCPNQLIRESFVFTALDFKSLIFYLLGGLGIFLFGIQAVSDSLRKIGGDNLKRVLAKITSNRVLGIGVGVVITALIQSSSATTVMTVGFVNASLLTLRQAISVVIGANIGTTITSQIIAFNVGEIALPAIALGTGFILFSKSYKVRSYGNIILAFGLIFFGLEMITDVVKPLRSSVYVSDFFVKYSENYLLAILVGTIITMIVQSSSATVGITMVLASTGLIDMKMAMSLVLGNNIGTTITATLASLGSSVNAKRTALSHVIFNVAGAAYMVVIIFIFGDYLEFAIRWFGGDTARQVANFHTFQKIINAAIFIPLIPLLEKTVIKLIPESDRDKKGVSVYLDESLLAEPILAINNIKLELGRMLKSTEKTVEVALRSLDSMNHELIHETLAAESENDQFQVEITDYIAKLSRLELRESDAARLPVLLHVTNDLEKAADFAQNIAEVSERKLDKEVEFNESQKKCIANMGGLAMKMMENLYYALENNDQARAKLVARQENIMNKFEIRYKRERIKEISQGKPVESAILTIDTISNIEKIGDHIYNVAQAIMGALSEDSKALYGDLVINTH